MLHGNAKRLAEASRHYDRQLEQSVLRELQVLSRCNTRVTADLVDPGGVWSTAGTSPVLRWPLTAVSRLDADSKDLICRYSTWKSGNVAEESQSSFAYDRCDVEQAGDEVVPADVQDPPLTPSMEGVKPIVLRCIKSSQLGFCSRTDRVEPFYDLS